MIWLVKICSFWNHKPYRLVVIDVSKDSNTFNFSACTCQSTRCKIPGDLNLHQNRVCVKKPVSFIIFVLWRSNNRPCAQQNTVHSEGWLPRTYNVSRLFPEDFPFRLNRLRTGKYFAMWVKAKWSRCWEMMVNGNRTDNIYICQYHRYLELSLV